MDKRISSETSYEYAGFWIRVLALVLDRLILTILEFVPIFLLIGNDVSFGSLLVVEEFLGSRIQVFQVAFEFIYFTGFLYTKGATPGKSALGLRVVDETTGRTVTLASAIIRYLCYILSALPLGLGFLWVAFSPKKQGWHDILAGTVVLKQIKKPSFSREYTETDPVSVDASVPQFKVYLSYPSIPELGPIEMPWDEPITIGRDFHASQIVMDNFDNSVSRAHAKLKVIGMGASVILEDCGSSNGTFLASGEALVPGVPITINQGQGFYLSKPEFSFLINRVSYQ
jgi:uncharacterized RDD family membrane protein YckC